MDPADERVLHSWYQLGADEHRVLSEMLEHFGVQDATELVALLASRACVERDALALDVALSVAAGGKYLPRWSG